MKKQLIPRPKTSVRLDEIIKDIQYYEIMKKKK